MPRSALAVLLAASVLVPASLPAATGDGGLSATIRYTAYGVPHVVARDYAGLGFGTGYAAAKDNLCLIAQGTVTLSGERSRYFGATGVPDGSLSWARTNLASDLFFTGVNDSGVVERSLRQPYPRGPRREVRELNRGWAAGFNEYLRENEITDPACKGAAWLRPITELDLHRRAYALDVFSGSGASADGMTNIQPTDVATPQDAAKTARALGEHATPSMGSNAFAVGGRSTATGRGLLLGNPHYPWHGGLRFWQVHQTIPGKLDVSGAALLGFPTVVIGYNSTFAWSHTVATGMPFSLTQLKLVPGDPTSYLVDGRREKMVQRRMTVRARQPDGTLKPVTGHQWWTRYGPIVTSTRKVELPWTSTTAFALNDPNGTNVRFSNTSLELGASRTTTEAVRSLKRTQGIPWVTTIAADSRGRALFAQVEVLPNITDDLAARCGTPLGKETFPASGVAVLDGSTSSCAPNPPTLSPDRYPVLETTGHVTNSNDSHWLTDPSRPLEGYDRVIGDERTQRSLRTRSAIVSFEERLAKGRITRSDIQDLTLAHRDHAAELAADATVTMCEDMRLGAPCDALRRWDRRDDTGSRGALLFGRFWDRALKATDLWTAPFDATDPVTTPRGLNTASRTVREALSDAVAELRTSGIPFDAPLGDHQYVVRAGDRVPIGGGSGRRGVLDVIEAPWTPGKGYTEVQGGTGYLQAVSFDGDRCPDAGTLLAYSQSSDPTSPHFADQTRLFSREQWVRAPFCEKDIAASPSLRTVTLR